MGLSSGPFSWGAQSLVSVSVSCHKPALTGPLTLSTLHPGSCGISASFVVSYFYVQPTKNPTSNLLSVLARKLDPEPWECAPRLINARYTMLPFTLYLPPSNTLKIHSHTCSCQYILVRSWSSSSKKAGCCHRDCLGYTESWPRLLKSGDIHVLLIVNNAALNIRVLYLL